MVPRAESEALHILTRIGRTVASGKIAPSVDEGRCHSPRSDIFAYERSMTYHERYMRIALEEAERALAASEVPVGAVVVRNGDVIGRGRNRTVELNDPTAHAELLAIREACAATGDPRLEGCTLYVTLEPCPMCAGGTVLARLAQVVFGAFDAKAGAAGTLYTITTDRRLNHMIETHGGVLDQECAAILRRFFLDRRSADLPGAAAPASGSGRVRGDAGV
jgi:tRNA(adenine34) deaminase